VKALVVSGHSYLEMRRWHGLRRDRLLGRTHFRTALETPAILPFSPKSLRMSVRKRGLSEFFRGGFPL
jgi:hypothetical protein